MVALVLLMVTAILLRVVPLRRLLPLCGQSLGAVACTPLTSPLQAARARAIRRCLLRAAARSPWRADCLPQALVAAILCRLRGVPASVHLGLRREGIGNGPLEAHAWACSGRIALCGGDGFETYTPLACFHRPRISAIHAAPIG